MPLLILFIAIPLIEIALFIQVGSVIGLWPTLLIVVVTAILGTFLVKKQGLVVLADVQKSFHNLQNPAEPLAHGAMILFSGALLLTPGFFTDALGFALLIPAFRSMTYSYLKARVKTAAFTTQSAQQPVHGDQTITDVEYSEVKEADNTTQPPSGWTRQ